MHIVLLNPQIPGNTGAISRLCAATGTDLHLIGELGFSLDDRYLKRAGLDYWPHVKLHLHDDLAGALSRVPHDDVAFYSSHATRPYTEFSAPRDAWFVLGREADGLPRHLLAENANRTYRIPITGAVRSLNLACAASIVLYDALGRHGFDFGPGA